ncbi:hypothetical protein FQR65_LT18236 [Abscondita terminalis]|nr:hypothetical protein FQR65_LT18236 [Abscondita terminalis]
MSCIFDNKPMKSTRRVHFDLPPTDGDTNSLDADAEIVMKQTAGDDLHLPTRASRPCYKITRTKTSRSSNGPLHSRHAVSTVNSAAPAAASPGGVALLRAARDGNDTALKDILRKSVLVGIPEVELNAVDNSGRTRRVAFHLPPTDGDTNFVRRPR